MAAEDAETSQQDAGATKRIAYRRRLGGPLGAQASETLALQNVSRTAAVSAAHRLPQGRASKMLALQNVSRTAAVSAAP